MWRSSKFHFYFLLLYLFFKIKSQEIFILKKPYLFTIHPRSSKDEDIYYVTNDSFIFLIIFHLITIYSLFLFLFLFLWSHHLSILFIYIFLSSQGGCDNRSIDISFFSLWQNTLICTFAILYWTTAIYIKSSPFYTQQNSKPYLKKHTTNLHVKLATSFDSSLSSSSIIILCWFYFHVA